MLLTVIGCTVDEQIDSVDLVPITISASVDVNMATRAATDVLSSSQFGTGETFYAYFPSGARVGNTTEGSSTTFVTSGNSGTSTPATQPYFNATATQTTVHAYYPYVTGKQVTEATASFSVETDQTSEAGYKKSDLMYATATIAKSSPSANLTFDHLMARIVVNATPGAGVTQIQAIRIVGGYRTIDISTPLSCTLGSSLSDLLSSSNITMYSGSATTTVGSAALIPPQTVGSSGSTTFLEITTEVGTAYYSVNNKAFASGMSYTYTINVDAASIGLTTDITLWSDEGTIALNNYGMMAFIESVDLGLSVKWANMNVSATSETDYGLYFAWGDVVGHSGDNDNGTATDGYSYDWSAYKWTDNGGSSFTKYTGSDHTTLQSADDAANAYMGSSWRMPTREEWEELLSSSNCNWIWQSNYNNSGIAGYLVTSRKPGYSQNAIFLPATGYRSNTSLTNQGTGGSYWSSAVNSAQPANAYGLSFNSASSELSAALRSYGCVVRPVSTEVTPGVKPVAAVGTAPTAISGLGYTGSAQSLVNAGTSAEGTLFYQMTTTATKPSNKSAFSTMIPAGTDAGTYYVWYYVKGDATHLDSEISATAVAVTIDKGSPSLSLSTANLSLTSSSPTGTITVSRSGDGAITATSSNTSVATTSVSGTTVTVTAIANGSATITIQMNQGTNYNAYTASDKTCSVSASGFFRMASSATSSDVGKVICSNGHIHSTVSEATAAGCTASGIIAYVGSAGSADKSTNSGSYIGLALALYDYGGSLTSDGTTCKWYTTDGGTCITNGQSSTVATAIGTTGDFGKGIDNTNRLATAACGSGHTHAAAQNAKNFSVARPAGASQWFLPTMYQWNLMVKAMCGKSTNLTTSVNNDYKADKFNEKITAAGGRGVLSNYYWSSVEYNTYYAWFMLFSLGFADYLSKSVNYRVRAVFAF
jgi:uncharacterized protein (TIGR02145 family)